MVLTSPSEFTEFKKKGPEQDKEKASLARLSWFGSAAVGWWVWVWGWGVSCSDAILH